MSKNTSDKKIDTWEWRDLTVFHKALTFEVRLERPLNVAEAGLRYYIHSEVPPIKVEAPELGPLRDKLDAAIRAFYAVTWEPVLVVRAKKEVSRYVSDGDKPSFSMKLMVVEYERGEMLGEKVFRKRITDPKVAKLREYDYKVQRGDVPASFMEFSGEPEQRQWILPATDEMRTMLGVFDARAEALIDFMTSQLSRAAL